MDQHPIPRQITTFEFKLIGFMTLKQFLYLLVAFPTAYIVIRVFPIPILNILLGVIIAVLGIVAAFLPIKDRTIDVWAKNMWKRLQNPTQYYYHKKNDSLYFLRDLYFLADPHHMLAHIESKEKLAQYLATTKQRPKANYAKKQVNALLQSPTQVLTQSVAPVVPTTEAPPQPPPLTPTQQLVQNKQVATAYVVPPAGPVTAVVIPPGQSIPAAQVPPAVPVPAAPVAPVTPAAAVQAPPPEPTPQFPMGGVGTYKLEEKDPQTKAPQPQVLKPEQQAPTVAPNTQSATSVTAAPKTDPFLAGVIRTSKKIPLPGVLVYVKDKQGNPLRILKTNPHGVFATFNSLPAGDYAFEIKDPNGTYFFDTMNLAVKDTNPMPFEFQSKEIL